MSKSRLRINSHLHMGYQVSRVVRRINTVEHLHIQPIQGMKSLDDID